MPARLGVGPPDVGQGAAYFFIRDGNSWRHLQTVSTPAPAAAAEYGSSVALNANRALIGAPRYDSLAGDAAGAAFVHTLSPCLNTCDADCNGTTNTMDINAFIAAIVSHVGCAPCAGDTNIDGTLNTFDVQGFVECLSQP